MNADRLSGLQVHVGLNGFCRIHMKGLHEPSRLVGPDRQKSDVDGSEAIPNFTEVSGISRVSAEVDQAPMRSDQITPPERPVAIEGPARGKMLCRGERDGRSRARRGRIPPVHFLDFLDAFFFFNDTVAKEIYTLSLHDAIPLT